MTNLKSKGFFSKFYSWLPIVVLYVAVLNEFDVNYSDLDFFSFNFPFILIFFFTLKDFKNFDYLLVFLVWLLNDTVVCLPLGLRSLSFMIICIATSYFRNITIRPNQIKDWFYFLFIIILVNSLNFSILTLFFSYNLILWSYVINNFFTFFFYLIFITIFKFYFYVINV